MVKKMLLASALITAACTSSVPQDQAEDRQDNLPPQTVLAIHFDQEAKNWAATQPSGAFGCENLATPAGCLRELRGTLQRQLAERGAQTVVWQAIFPKPVPTLDDPFGDSEPDSRPPATSFFAGAINAFPGQVVLGDQSGFSPDPDIYTGENRRSGFRTIDYAASLGRSFSVLSGSASNTETAESFAIAALRAHSDATGQAINIDRALQCLSQDLDGTAVIVVPQSEVSAVPALGVLNDSSMLSDRVIPLVSQDIEQLRLQATLINALAKAAQLDTDCNPVE